MPNLEPPFKLNYEHLSSLYENKTYSNYHPQTIQGRRHENVQVSSDGLILKLQDKTQMDTVSVLVLEDVNYHGSDFYEVKWTYSKYKKRNYLSYLFDLAVNELNYIIISDSHHTSPGSKEFWISLHKKQKYDLFIFNIESGYKRRYINYPIYLIWGIDSYNRETIDESISDETMIDLFDNQDFYDDYIEIEGFEEIDTTASESNPTTKEIKYFLNKWNGKIKDRSSIRLIAQKPNLQQ